MQFKVHDGTVRHDRPSLCASCGHASIILGETIDQRIVECQAGMMRTKRIPFRVTSCSDYADRTQPSYAEMVRVAWILQPHATRRRPAGFIRSQDLSVKELDQVLDEGPEP